LNPAEEQGVHAEGNGSIITLLKNLGFNKDSDKIERFALGGELRTSDNSSSNRRIQIKQPLSRKSSMIGFSRYFSNTPNTLKDQDE